MDRHRLNTAASTSRFGSPSGGSSDFDLNPEVAPAARDRSRPASVLVPLVERGAGLRLILTRRAALLKHHPGQVAFPGGKQDPADATPLAAALREAREEIGLRARGRRDPRRTRPARDGHRLHRHALRRSGRRRASGR